MKAPPKLSPKEKKFIQAYLTNGGNSRQAAIAAGSTKVSADKMASRLLLKEQVRDSIEVRQSLTTIDKRLDDGIELNSLDESRQMYREIYRLAMLAGDFTPAKGAIDSLAKINGHMTAQPPSSQPVLFNINLYSETPIEGQKTPPKLPLSNET